MSGSKQFGRTDLGLEPDAFIAHCQVDVPVEVLRSIYASTMCARVVWGSLAERVCGRVGLIVAPESGAYTVACIEREHILSGSLWPPSQVHTL